MGSGEPEFRIMSQDRYALALRQRRCWVCGDKLGAHVSFVAGPMCAVNRTSAEPPSHRDCAEWSARNCPFLSRPHMRRREAGLPVVEEAPGIAIKRNPGVIVVWTTKQGRYKPFEVPDGRGVLFDMGEPLHVSWWAEGRLASREEILHSMSTGLPSLRELAEQEGVRAVRELDRYVDRAMGLVPA
jgi:hypothetical protein